MYSRTETKLVWSQGRSRLLERSRGHAPEVISGRVGQQVRRTVQLYTYADNKPVFTRRGRAEAVEVTAMLVRVPEKWTSPGDRETSGRRTSGRRYAILIKLCEKFDYINNEDTKDTLTVVTAHYFTLSSYNMLRSVNEV